MLILSTRVGAIRVKLAAAAALLVVLAPPAGAADPPEWTRPAAPFHVIGPIDYVGTEGLGSYLIHTRAGSILIDAPMAENVAALERNIAARDKLRNVKLILLSHAHFDHAGGLAALKKATGARLVVGAADKQAVETGTPPGEVDYGVIRFPAAPVDRGIRDGETVTLGGVTLTAVATPGHTPGCTSWRMRVVDRGTPRDILFACSITVAGNRLVGNRAYPGIVGDFRHSFDRLAAGKADIVLPFHTVAAELRERAGRGALVDATALPKLVQNARTAFAADLAKQEQAAK